MAYKAHDDAELLQAALVGYQHQQAILRERIAEITRELGGRGVRADAAGIAKPKRTMSAATRRRMAAAQQKRRAEAKKAGAKAKHKMSVEGRERIAEATRKRWEAYRVAKPAGQ